MATSIHHVEIRYRRSTPPGTWSYVPLPPNTHSISIPGVDREVEYDVQARAVASNGAASAWVQQSHTVAAASPAWALLGNPDQAPIGQPFLFGEAPATDAGQIECQGFTYGTVAYFPSGSQFITGLTQGSSYFVYVDDPSSSGGDLQPAATQDANDLRNRIGRFYIGQVTVPVYISGDGTSVGPYRPSNSVEQGSRSTQNPELAFDGSSDTCATISGQATGTIEHGTETSGDRLYEDFPAVTLTAAATLKVDAVIAISGTGCEVQIVAVIGGVSHGLADATTSAGRQVYQSPPIASGTNIGDVTVEISASAENGATTSLHSARIDVYDIRIEG